MNIAPAPINPTSISDQVELSYGAWAERLVVEGWTPHLLTFMFQPIGGSPATVLRTMEREVERVYATFVTRVVRHPLRASATGRLPVWLCAPDRPVRKHARQSLRDVAVNDGQHFHAIVFLPPWSRLQEDLVEHFIAHADLYVRPGHALDRIDVEPITHRVGYVVGYGRKSIARGCVHGDATLILPRTWREMAVQRTRRAASM